MGDSNWARFDRDWKLEPDEDSEPVFVLAAGWRSGSTLLQRLICSSGEVLLWGEPYARCSLLPALTRSALGLREDWPSTNHFASEKVYENLSQYWIANLYPPPQAIRNSYKAAVDAFLKQPAEAKGFSRFGLKEVRLQAMEAHFLQWLYPSARFVFLVRNPWDAWRSSKGMGFILRWPNVTVDNPTVFARHWRALTESFLGWQGENSLMLRYEDLVAPGFDLGVLKEHCRLSSIDPSVMDRVIRGVKRPPLALGMEEIEEIRSIVEPVASTVGYRGLTVESTSAAA